MRIRHAAVPGLSAAKGGRAVGLPEHRCGPVHSRAHEIPLPTAEVPGARQENDPLVEAAKLDPEPTFVLAAHVGAHHAGGDLTPVRMRPRNSTTADVCAGLNAPLRVSRFRSSLNPSCKQTRSRGRPIRQSSLQIPLVRLAA
jgi:hypothetical protein